MTCVRDTVIGKPPGVAGDVTAIQIMAGVVASVDVPGHGLASNSVRVRGVT